MNEMNRHKAIFLGCTAALPLMLAAMPAHAQNAAAAPEKPGMPATPAATTTDSPTASPVPPQSGSTSSRSADNGIAEIVVTAQRREQSLQDVPIAITAITQSSLQANRIVDVGDLSGIAPNVTVREAAGSSQIPSFTSRGITSYGVVPGSDKEFSIYLDGVYLGSSHALFQLPDIERIEVLRGPQGTLFGRNSTSGAVSVVTRDPAGVFGVHVDATTGNYQQYRGRVSIDTPSVGPLSAYISYVHDERRGDIRNTGVGTVQDRTGPATGYGVGSSPRYLGSQNQEQVFAAIKLDASDNLKMVYKFDYSVNDFTPSGTAFVAYNASSPLIGSLLQALITSQPTPVQIDASAQRPGSVNNSFVLKSYQKVYGHNLTSTLAVGDHINLKNIAAYRYSYVSSSSQLDGLGGLTFTPQAIVPYATLAAFSTVPGLALAPPAVQGATIGAFAQGIAPLVGQRFLGVANLSQDRNKQYSDELQATYTSELLTFTAGGLYFHQTSISGGPQGLYNTITFTTSPASGRAPLGAQGVSFNRSTSIAGYAQAEVNLTDKLQIVGGGRVTNDKKSGHYDQGGTYVFPTGQPNNYTGGTFTGIRSFPFRYNATKFTYSGGVNYKPVDALLLYGKYSTGFVSGGSLAGIAWAPETVKSAEIGVKADLLDRRLRTNIALFTADYHNLQAAQSGVTVGRPELGTVIINQGSLRARGVEAEVTAVPVRGITLNGNLGYTDAHYLSLTPLFIQSFGTGYKPTLLPKITSHLSAQYETPTLGTGSARLFARADADFRSRIRFISGSLQSPIAAFAPILSQDPRWLVNTRVGVRDLGPLNLAVSFWTKNLTNNRDPSFPVGFSTYLVATTFQEARTYGLDVSFRF